MTEFNEEDTILPFRSKERSWGNTIVPPEAQAVTDSLVAEIAGTLSLDDHQMRFLAYQLRSHTLHMCYHMREAAIEELTGPTLYAVDDDGTLIGHSEADILQHPSTWSEDPA